VALSSTFRALVANAYRPTDGTNSKSNTQQPGGRQPAASLQSWGFAHAMSGV